MSLETMASKGSANLNRKLPGMSASYSASSTRAQANYGKMPFGATRKANYNSAWSTNPGNYSAAMTADKVSKWRENWIANWTQDLLGAGEDAGVVPPLGLGLGVAA